MTASHRHGVWFLGSHGRLLSLIWKARWPFRVRINPPSFFDVPSSSPLVSSDSSFISSAFVEIYLRSKQFDRNWLICRLGCHSRRSIVEETVEVAVPVHTTYPPISSFK